MKKRGYYYTIDAVVGVIILIVGILIIAGLYLNTPEKGKTQALTNDITGLLYHVKVSDICSDLVNCQCTYESMTEACDRDFLTDPDMSLMEVIGFLYHKNRFTLIGELVNETIIEQEILPQTHDMQLILQDPNDFEKLNQIYP